MVVHGLKNSDDTRGLAIALADCLRSHLGCLRYEKSIQARFSDRALEVLEYRYPDWMAAIDEMRGECRGGG